MWACHANVTAVHLARILIQFQHHRPHEILDCGERHAHALATVKTFVEQLKESGRTTLLTCLLEGPHGRYMLDFLDAVLSLQHNRLQDIHANVRCYIVPCWCFAQPCVNNQGHIHFCCILFSLYLLLKQMTQVAQVKRCFCLCRIHHAIRASHHNSLFNIRRTLTVSIFFLACSGKTALAATIGIDIGFPFIKIVRSI